MLENGGVAVALVAAALALLYWYLTSTFSYWRNKGVPQVTPRLLVGSVGRVLTMREHFSTFVQRIYYQYPDQPVVGFYQGRVPTLLVRDPEICKRIVISDFSHFTDHGLKFSETYDPLVSRNLFNMAGQRWKDMRTKLSPTFTSGRMKTMFPLVQECAHKLQRFMGDVADSGKDVELKDLMARYTTTVIASAVFGISCDAIYEPQAVFRKMSVKLVEADLITGLKTAAITFIPGIADTLGLSFFKKECEPYFRSLVREIENTRAKAGGGGVRRGDFMELLLQLKETGRLEPETGEHAAEDKSNGLTAAPTKFSEDDVMAQALVFFFAGFETSSSALTFALYELARRPELQRKAREHIEEVLARHGGHVTYQALQDMTYLDWILSEALRKYPTLTSLFRECTKNYVLPDSNITIERGTPVFLAIHAMQSDPQYFPEPEVFRPERFDPASDQQPPAGVYMPFGEGPRQCIGLRFAKMQSKLGLLSVLREFEVAPSALSQYKLTADPRQFLYMAREDAFVKVARVRSAK